MSSRNSQILSRRLLPRHPHCDSVSKGLAAHVSGKFLTEGVRWLTGLKMMLCLLTVLLPDSILIAAADEATQVEITADRTSVMAGSTQLGTVNKGEQFTILGEQGSWIQIEFEKDSQKRRGWILKTDVRKLESTAAENKPPIAEPQQWLRVTAEKADVKLGSKTVSSLRRNTVLPIRGTIGRWHQIEVTVSGAGNSGYIADSDVEIISATLAAPSVTGHTPFSISNAEAALDGNTEELTLTAAIPLDNRQFVRAIIPADALTTGGSESELSLETLPADRSDSPIRIRITPDQWSALNRLGTSSVWLKEGDGAAVRNHRLDLPPLELHTAVTAQKYPDFDEGLVLSLSVRGLLPGYHIEHAYQSADGRFLQRKVIKRTRESSPRLADLVAAKSPWGATVRVVVPFARSASETIQHVFVVCDADGAQSQILRVTQRGDTVPAAADVLQSQRPLPVDTTVIVPAVELLVGTSAASAVRSAGLQPVFVDQESWRPVPQETATQHIVLRQGTAAGERVPVGSPLLLGVHSREGITTIDRTTFFGESLANDEQTTSPETLADNGLAIDTDTRFGFVDVNVPAAIQGAGGLLDLLNSPAFGANHPVDAADSGLLDGTSAVDLPEDQQRLLKSGAAIPVDSDPGVMLDGGTDAAAAANAGILKVLTDAILEQPRLIPLAGLPGKSIERSVREFEKQLSKPVDSDEHQVAVAGILQVIVEVLQIELSEPQRNDALIAWKSRQQFDLRGWIDVNRNGAQADDVALFFIEWLSSSALYQPASQVVMTQNIAGHSVAVFPTEPVSPDWLEKLLELLKQQGNQNTAGVPIVPPVRPVTVIDPLSLIPAGNPVVAFADGPDSVRVPDVQRSLLSEAKPRLDDLGLQISNLEELFASDRVTESDPDPGEWVKTDADVRLNVVRRVPDVLKRTFRAAEMELQSQRLRAEVQGTTFPDDLVIRQSPDAGEYISPGRSVVLTLAKVTPSVVGKLFPEARETLTKHDLKWTTDARTFDIDQVVAQSPPAGALLHRGDSLRLTLHVPVPNVSTGRTLEQALADLRSRDLAASALNKLARANDRVVVQDPPAGRFVPHGSTVTLRRIVTTLPDVAGRRMVEARRILSTENGFKVKSSVSSSDEDLVMQMSPRSGTEIERGESVEIDPRVAMPKIFRGQNIVGARRRLEGLPNRISLHIDRQYWDSDVVYSVDRREGELLAPGTQIRLVPGVEIPDFHGMDRDSASRLAQNLNVVWEWNWKVSRYTTDDSLIGSFVTTDQNISPGLHVRGEFDRLILDGFKYLPDLTEVPDVVGTAMSVSDAREAIEKAELVASFKMTVGDFGDRYLTWSEVVQYLRSEIERRQLETVKLEDLLRQTSVLTDQNPPAGTSVKKRTAVVVTVNLGQLLPLRR